MSDPVTVMKNHKPTKNFLIAIDSDGCAFDSMEIKQKECFTPMHCKHFGLQPIAKYARMAAEFVNLYSKWRGINRFPALLKTFDLLNDWDKVQERGFKCPEVPNLRKWVETETKLGNPALEAYCKAHSEEEMPDMHQTLRWSKEINVMVSEIVQGGLPPFPHVRESLEKAKKSADILVCSQTPYEALAREWEEQGMAHFPFIIAGQEHGTKAEHIAMTGGGKYEPTHILMIGDAFGDLKAARANNALFYPINPGNEEESWEMFYNEALDRFLAGTYAGEYEAARITDFEKYLPEVPPWKHA